MRDNHLFHLASLRLPYICKIDVSRGVWLISRQVGRPMILLHTNHPH